MEHLVFFDSVSFLPCPLGKLPEAFELTPCTSSYPHYFNSEENLDYLGPNSDVKYYGVNWTGEEDRREFSRGTRDRNLRSPFSTIGACWKVVSMKS